MRTNLRSDPENVFLVKVWFPLFCVLVAISLSGGSVRTPGFFLACPLIVAALFGLSVASVEVRGGVLRYRRLLRWRTIAREEIVGARVEAPPIGSIRLKRLLFPWGRLYFALDRDINPKLFRQGEYPLLNYIRDGREPAPEDDEAGKSQAKTDRAVALKLVIAALAGAFFILQIFISSLVVPHRLFEEPPAPRAPIDAFMFRLSGLLARFEVQVTLLAVFAFLAVYKRRHPYAVICAFLAGTGLPYVFLHWLNS